MSDKDMFIPVPEVVETTTSGGVTENGTVPGQAPKSRPLMQAARFFSAVFHPFCIPLIGMSCLLYGHTMLALFSTVSKLYVLWVLAALTLIMPFALLRALRWTGIFRWLPDDERGRQALMMLVFLVCYLGAGGMLWHFLAVDMIRRIFFGGIMLLAIGFGVNKYWPVGLHLMAIGAMTGFLFSTQVTRFGEVTGLLLVTIAAAGVLGSARIYLGRNDLAQVGIGFGIGFWLMFLFTFL